MKLLDLGVGDGYTIRLVKPIGPISGVDINPVKVEEAQSRGIEAKAASVYRVPFEDSSFDVVTCFEVLEHLEHPVLALREAKRLLRPWGFIVVTTPVDNAAWNLLWWGWTRFGAGKIWAKDPHVRSYHVWGSSGSAIGLSSILTSVGFIPERVLRCNYGMIAGMRAVRSSDSDSIDKQSVSRSEQGPRKIRPVA